MGVMAAVSLAMTAASTVMQHKAADKAADDQNALAAQNAENAREAAITQYGQLEQRELQEREASPEPTLSKSSLKVRETTVAAGRPRLWSLFRQRSYTFPSYRWLVT